MKISFGDDFFKFNGLIDGIHSVCQKWSTYDQLFYSYSKNSNLRMFNFENLNQTYGRFGRNLEIQWRMNEWMTLTNYIIYIPRDWESGFNLTPLL